MDVSVHGRIGIGAESHGFDLFARLEAVQEHPGSRGQIGPVLSAPAPVLAAGAWTLTGRIGAEHPGDGKDIGLRVNLIQLDGQDVQEVTGWIGGNFEGFGVQAQVNAQEVSGRLGEGETRRDILMRAEGDAWRGAYGSTSVNARLQGKVLTGSMSGQAGDGLTLTLNGRDVPLPRFLRALVPRRVLDVNLTLNNMDASLALLLASCTYRALEEGQGDMHGPFQ